MPAETCRVSERNLRGYRAIVLEHDHVAVVVLPAKGAEIYSIVYKPLDFDVLWKAPWGLHQSHPALIHEEGSEAAWMDCYCGGWQGIFPNAGNACVYSGAHHSFHGEATVAAWDYSCSATGTRATVGMEVSLRHSPFHLYREVNIESGSLEISVKESFVNLGLESAEAMWGHHPALAADLLCCARIGAPAKHYLPHLPETSPTSRVAHLQRHPWPIAQGKNGELIDLSLLPGEERLSEMGYLADFERGELRVSNSKLGLGVELHWDHNLFPYVWYWREWGGTQGYPWFGRCRVAALEPFSSIPGSGLAKAVEAGSALSFAPNQTRSTEITMAVLPLQVS